MIPLQLTSMTCNKYLTPKLKEDNDPIAAKFAPQITSFTGLYNS